MIPVQFLLTGQVGMPDFFNRVAFEDLCNHDRGIEQKIEDDQEPNDNPCFARPVGTKDSGEH